MVSGKLRMSILNVDDDVTPLKFRGWLRSELASIEGSAATNDIIIIRLFIPNKLLFGLTQRKLDSVCGDLVEKFDHIQRIETVLVEKSLGFAEMQEEGALAKQDLAELSRQISKSSDNSLI